MDRALLLALSFGHLVVDFFQGAIPVLLPGWKEAFALSYATAGSIVLASNISSSVVQPIFGLLSDRMSTLWLLPAGIALGAFGLGVAIFAPSYPIVVAGVLLSGLGVAAYHPEASKVAHLVAGRRRATGMAVFSVGGNVGIATGAMVMGWLAARSGALEVLAPVALAIAALAVLGWARGRLPRREPAAPGAPAAPASPQTAARPVPADARARGSEAVPAGRRDLRSFLTLGAVVVMRSWVHAGITSFVPLYFVRYRGGDQAHASLLVSLFLAAGALGTLVGGPAADRFGRRPVLLSSFLVASPAVLAIPWAPGWGGAFAAALAGFALISTFSVSVVFAQELLAGHLGVASGVILGLSVGTGGLGVTALGAVVDRIGMGFAFPLLALLPWLGVLLVLRLPGGVPQEVATTPAARGTLAARS